MRIEKQYLSPFRWECEPSREKRVQLAVSAMEEVISSTASETVIEAKRCRAKMATMEVNRRKTSSMTSYQHWGRVMCLVKIWTNLREAGRFGIPHPGSIGLIVFYVNVKATASIRRITIPSIQDINNCEVILRLRRQLVFPHGDSQTLGTWQ